MKKILIAFAVLVVVNLACKKLSDHEPLCACSPVSYPGFNLVVKNAAGTDLLDVALAGAFKKDQIQLFQKDAGGTIKQIEFQIRLPFSYGNDKFAYHFLQSYEITRLMSINGQQFYLKLGDQPAMEISFVGNNGTKLLEKVLINQKEIPLETTGAAQYIGPIFYLNL
jgi:hypothetical protein